jgi:uncharacterized protein
MYCKGINVTPIIERVSRELTLPVFSVAAVVELFDADATVPFIARYRKEKTGGLDETRIMEIRDRIEDLRNLEKRRDYILKTLEKQGVLGDDIKAGIEGAESKEVLEDLYLPYKAKRRTRAAAAREKGLGPLAEAVVNGQGNIPEYAALFVSEEKGVLTLEAALAGARDILAEWISEDPEVRTALRLFFRERAVLSSKVVPGKEEAGKTYRDYFAYSGAAARVPSHRFLAVRRGETEGFLRMQVVPDGDTALAIIKRELANKRKTADQLLLSIEDAYERLLKPSLENELIKDLEKSAHLEAIRVFAENLRDILLEPPLGRKRVLALDPGFRTGCKVVCIDGEGKLLHHTAVYPLEPHGKTEEAGKILLDLIRRFSVEAVAVGNGTGGREAEAFLKGLLAAGGIPVLSVNESGASVYSASETARREFPDYDVTVRGAVSIGRRLQDPLSEIVKIDPKAIGVGQYQHDVDQNALKKALDDVVALCVNAVGVTLNSSSFELLRYVSGLQDRLAKAVVERRNEKGPFRSRKELLSVPGMGPKTFEQCAGFLRIPDGEEPLDGSAVHPERYELVYRMARDAGCAVTDLLRQKEAREKIGIEKYADDTVGLPTLRDIIRELEKPGRDPRREFFAFSFAEGVTEIKDLVPGMVLPGIVTNVTNFGAFVDIGVHQDGLVHVGELSERYVRDPREAVKVRQRVNVRVLSVDADRKRIALSMKG